MVVVPVNPVALIKFIYNSILTMNAKAGFYRVTRANTTDRRRCSMRQIIYVRWKCTLVATYDPL